MNSLSFYSSNEMGDEYKYEDSDIYTSYGLKVELTNGSVWYWSGRVTGKNPMFGFTQFIDEAMEYSILDNAKAMLRRIIANASGMGLMNIRGGSVLEVNCCRSWYSKKRSDNYYQSSYEYLYTVNEMSD